MGSRRTGVLTRRGGDGRPCGDTARRWPSASQGGRPRSKHSCRHLGLGLLASSAGGKWISCGPGAQRSGRFEQVHKHKTTKRTSVPFRLDRSVTSSRSGRKPAGPGAPGPPGQGPLPGGWGALFVSCVIGGSRPAPGTPGMGSLTRGPCPTEKPGRWTRACGRVGPAGPRERSGPCWWVQTVAQDTRGPFQRPARAGRSPGPHGAPSESRGPAVAAQNASFPGRLPVSRARATQACDSLSWRPLPVKKARPCHPWPSPHSC